MKVFIYSKNDFPDNFRLQPSFVAMPTPGLTTQVTLTKKISEKVSTKRSPCGNFAQVTCGAREEHREAMEKYQCDTSFLSNGSFLDDLRQPNIPFCNISVLMDVLCKDRSAECVSAEPCYYETYKAHFIHEANTQNASQIKLKYERMMVDHVKEYISYDGQSLFSEIGGTMGLCLGISGRSLYESLASSVMNIFERFSMSKLLK